MGVYSRYKGKPGGFRALVELLETTPLSRREKMVSVGMLEDPEFTTRALKLMLTWEDIIALPDAELAEVISKSPPQSVGYAIHNLEEDVKKRFIKCTPPKLGSEVRDTLELKAGKSEISGGRAKLIQVARQCEREGYVRVKRIPENA